MFAKCGKKEIWIGTSMETSFNGKTELEISWGREGRRVVVIPFEDFVEGELDAHERGGPNCGGSYDESVIEIFRRMRKILKIAMDHAKERNRHSDYDETWADEPWAGA